MTVTRAERDAARRLRLPTPDRWTAREQAEALDCNGCTARYEGRTRVVYARPGCPVHSRREARP